MNLKLFHVGNDPNPDSCTYGTGAPGFALGSIRGAAVPVALDRIGHFLYRNLDAECRRGLADDADDHEPPDDWTGTSGGSIAGIFSDPARGRARRHG